MVLTPLRLAPIKARSSHNQPDKRLLQAKARQLLKRRLRIISLILITDTNRNKLVCAHLWPDTNHLMVAIISLWAVATAIAEITGAVVLVDTDMAATNLQ